MLEVVCEANVRRTKMSHASMSHEKRKGVKKMKKEKITPKSSRKNHTTEADNRSEKKPEEP